ncbi:branched-chain amino acid ABC transporter permease [uncultured Amnibacterium sp.]|uniref:branched-chain amino acid ABC transporter permease n=1 Tax=uncultured Amnibacterium sp. TaxID=1631851 RepID=UPI0035C94829
MEVLAAVIQGLLLGGLFALAATGLSIMFGVMRIVNLAHGDLAILAAFVAFVLVVQTALPLWIVVIAAVVVFGFLGYGVQRLLLGRSLRTGPLATLLVTFGLSIIIQNLLLEGFSADTRTLDAGVLTTAAWRVAPGIAISTLALVTFALAIGVIVAVQLFLSRTRTGRLMRATSDDPATAALVGSNAKHIYGVATAIAFATIALAGVLYAMRSSFDPSLGPTRLIFAFEAVVIGGLGSLWGTLVGGMVLGVTQTVVAVVDPSLSLLAGHLVFLAVLAFRPQGVLAGRTV